MNAPDIVANVIGHSEKADYLVGCVDSEIVERAEMVVPAVSLEVIVMTLKPYEFSEFPGG